MCIHSLYFDTFCTIYISIFKYILIFFLFIHHVYPLAVLLQGHPDGLPIPEAEAHGLPQHFRDQVHVGARRVEHAAHQLALFHQKLFTVKRKILLIREK